MKTRVYIETTIPSAYYSLRTDVESVARMNWTRRWWAEYSETFKLVSSPAVITELRRGTEKITETRVALLKTTELLEVTEFATDVANIYIQRLVMPNDPGGDALHLAVASIHKVDVLLTWNCRHLANPSKMEHIRLVNFELGLQVPLVTTPLNYLSGDEADAQ
jgi:hypothetical protein